MNPWAILVILIGIVLIVIGIKGTQHNITSAITGIPHSGAGAQQQQQGQQGKTGPPGRTIQPGQLAL